MAIFIVRIQEFIADTKICHYSITKSCLTLCDLMHLQKTRLPCPSLSPRVCSNSCPSSQWCHSTITASVLPLSPCLQSFPASESFPMSQFFTSGDQSTGVSTLASVLPMNIQDWFPFGLSGLICLHFRGLTRVFFNATVKNHQLFSAQLYLWSNSYIHTWLLEKP